MPGERGPKGDGGAKGDMVSVVHPPADVRSLPYPKNGKKIGSVARRETDLLQKF